MKINNNLIFIVVFLMISCGEAPLTPEEQVAQDEANDTRAKILMTMTDDLSLTISVANFSSVSFIKFDLLKILSGIRKENENFEKILRNCLRKFEKKI